MSEYDVKIVTEESPLTISLPVQEMIEKPFSDMRQAAGEIGKIYNGATGTDFIKEPGQVPYGVYRGFRDVYVTIRNRGEELDVDSLGRFLGTLIEFRKSLGRRSTGKMSPGMLSRSYETFLRQRPGFTRGEQAQDAQRVLNEAHRVAGKALEEIGTTPAKAAVVTLHRFAPYILEGEATTLHPRDHEAAKRLSNLLSKVQVNVKPANVPIELIHGFVKICELSTKGLREIRPQLRFRPLFHKTLTNFTTLIEYQKARAGVWVDPTKLSRMYEEYLLWVHEDGPSEATKNDLDKNHLRVRSALRAMGVDVELPEEPKLAIGEDGYAFTLNVESEPLKVSAPADMSDETWNAWLDFMVERKTGISTTAAAVDAGILIQDVYRAARLDPGRVSEEVVATYRNAFSEQMGSFDDPLAFVHSLFLLEHTVLAKAKRGGRIGPKGLLSKYTAALRAISRARNNPARVTAEIIKSNLTGVDEKPAPASRAQASVASKGSVWDRIPFAMGEALSSPISKSPGIVPGAGALGEAFWGGRVPTFSITQRSVDAAPVGLGDIVESKGHSDFIDDRSLRRTRIIYLAGGLHRDEVTAKDVGAFLSVFMRRTKAHEQSADDFADSLRFFALLIAGKREKTGTKFGVNTLLREYAQTMKYISALGINGTMESAGIRKPELSADVKEAIAKARAGLDRATEAARKQRWAKMLGYAQAAMNLVVNRVPFAMGEALSDLTVVGKRDYPDVERGLGRAMAEFYTTPSTKKSDKGGTPTGTVSESKASPTRRFADVGGFDPQSGTPIVDHDQGEQTGTSAAILFGVRDITTTGVWNATQAGMNTVLTTPIPVRGLGLPLFRPAPIGR